jgi:hypothetical protein
MNSDHYEVKTWSDEPGWNSNTGPMYHDTCYDEAVHFIKRHVEDNMNGTVKVENEDEQLIYAEWSGDELYVEGLMKEQFVDHVIEDLEIEFKHRYGLSPDVLEVLDNTEKGEKQTEALNFVCRVDSIKEQEC